MLSDEEEKELWEERAAIREFLGGYTRKQAELLAYEDVQQILRGNDEKYRLDFSAPEHQKS